MKYLVISPGEREIVIEAKNSIQAKRKACRYWGIKPSDKWCGITALTARRCEDYERRDEDDQTQETENADAGNN